MNPFRRPSVRYGKTPAPETPYQKAAQVWDERIGSARVQARNWRLIAFGNLALAGGLAAALVWQATRGTIVPWVVQVDKLGEAQVVAPAIADYRPSDAQIAWYLAQFIEQVRSVGVDPIILRQNWLKAYDFVTDRGALALNDYARTNDPFAKIGKGQVAVDVSSVIRASPDSFRDRLGRTPLRERCTRGDRALDRDRHRRHRTPRTTPTGCAKIRSGYSSTPSTGRRSSADAVALHYTMCPALSPAALPTPGSRRRFPTTSSSRPCWRPIRRSRSRSWRCRSCCRFPASSSRSRARRRRAGSEDPKERVDKANAAARVQPTRNGYINAVQVYPFADGALYQVYAAPGEVTDIALQEGEQLVGSGPVAAGDTVRWIIGDTESGAGASKRIHILVKPTRPDLVTNLVINTDRRTYLLELRSTEKTYMASVSWQYPQDQLIALRRQAEAAEAATPIDSGVDIGKLRFRYAIEGDNPPWRPTRLR